MNVPPEPVNLVHTPPVCSPAIRFAKVMVAVLLSHTLILPSVPAFTGKISLTVSILEAIQPTVPTKRAKTVYVAAFRLLKTGDDCQELTTVVSKVYS